MYRRALVGIGLVAFVVGAVFALQGFGVLGGSFMSGSGVWAVIGLAMIAVGATAYGFGTRRRQ
jgi:hypothetical protein